VSFLQRIPRLYPILDTSFLPLNPTERRQFLASLTIELGEAGVQILQYRNKQGSDAEILADASILRASAPASLKLILNDRVDLLAATAFDGVHVGQQDLSPSQARSIIGSDTILGVSTHNEAQLRAAAQQPVDYIAIGPVFPTASKQNPDPVIGLEGVRLARTLTEKPLVAIGGITLQNAKSVLEAGADSIAVISAIFTPGRSPVLSAKDFFRVFK
jgi:thiamine-phosphate pyrophosphorylase